MNDFDPTFTTWLIIGSAVAWILWDIKLYMKGQFTISEKINKWGRKMLPLVFALGFLMGHFFW